LIDGQLDSQNQPPDGSCKTQDQTKSKSPRVAQTTAIHVNTLTVIGWACPFVIGQYNWSFKEKAEKLSH